MKVDVIFGGTAGDAKAAATAAENLGADGFMVPEVAHDPFVSLSVAATVTERIRLSSGIAVAFARNPMTVAVTASDVHRLSGGRFVLGLGSQIRPHVTRRFSMPWSAPAPRMREFVAAVRAIWAAWEHGTPLSFEGEHYRHTLMTPMFSHGPSPCGWPPICLAGVGAQMTALAGEVAEGFIAHGFTTASYVREVTIPGFEVGLARTGRARTDIEVAVPAMVAVVDGDADPRLASLRSTLAFYGSTPAYRGVLEHHGWGALGEAHRMSTRGQWQEMGALIDDDVLHTFAAVGSPVEVAAELVRRYEGVADRVQLGAVGDAATTQALVDALHGTQPGGWYEER